VDQRIRGSDLAEPPARPRRPKSDWRDWEAESDEASTELVETQANIEGLIPDQTAHTDADPGSDLLEGLLRSAPPRERFFIRMYVRSNKASDQAVGRARCIASGVDYDAIYEALHGKKPTTLPEV
jgi:hypothetical protein